MHPGLTKKKYMIQAPPSTFQKNRPVLLQAGGETSTPDEEEPLRSVTFKVKDRHVLYAKGVIGALVSVFGILVVFSILLVLAANKVESSVSPLGRSLKEGKLNKLVTEGHLALHSMRKLTESIPIDKVMNHWENTNKILESNKIPWEELPQWRLFAQNAFRMSTQMMQQHPDWAKDIEKSTRNLKDTASPLANESKEWRKSLRGASAAYAKTLMSMYKEYLHEDD